MTAPSKCRSILALCLLSPLSLAAAEPHPFSIHDMLAMQRISDPQPSPDGTRVAFVLRTTDLEANKGTTNLWLVTLADQAVRQLTSHQASDNQPRWSSDGKSLFFLSSRSGSSQVWRLPIDGGEAQPVTDLPLDVGAFALSPAGAHLAVALEVFPDCQEIACTVTRLDELAKRPASGQLFDHLLVRHWDSWKDGRRSHLFVVPIEGGEAVDAMQGMDADSPSKPFGGPEELSFTPDGKGLVFAARDVGREEAWSTDFDLYLSPIDGRAPPRCLTEANQAWDTAPLFSPDGKTLAYLAMRRPRFEADRYRVVLRAWPDGPERVLTEDWDRSPSSMVWAADGKTLFVTADNLGQGALFSIDVASGRVSKLLSDGTVRSPGVAAGGKLVFGRDHLQSPVELYSLASDGTGLAQVTRINHERVAAAQMGQPEQFTFAGWNGEAVHAYVVRPAGFEAGERYPVAFLIHGGPQGSFGNDFHYRWNPQAYAGAGYAAVMVDFHGSTGYGQAFTDSIREDWGGKPLEDLQKGLAAALELYPWLDGDRVCALGGSYGGYMINWIAGNWPDRFRCLVNHDGNLDEQMAYYDTEELWFPEWERGSATPWESPEAYQKHNPINHVGEWRTPMLVVHGALDYRVVDTQGLSTFTALQRRNIPSQLLYFPDENHWVLKPQNSILWYETVLAWLNRWLRATDANR